MVFGLAVLMLGSAAPMVPAQDTTVTALVPATDEKGMAIDPMQKLYRHNLQGNRAFDEDGIEEALREYVEAQALAPNDPRVLYNMGNALAKQGRSEHALSMLERAALETEAPELERDARFNRGVLQMEEEDLQGALRSFGEALIVDPSDAASRRNLELVLRKLQDQDQDQDQQQEQSPEQSEQQKDQDQEQQEQEQEQEQQQDEQDQQQNNQQQPQPRDANRDEQREAARRLLKALENAEKQELKKALQQKMPNLKDRKEDW